MNPNLEFVENNPTPAPSPTSTIGPQPTHNKHIRFYDKTYNGETFLEDMDTGYLIKKIGDSEYIGYDKNWNEIYHIYPDGVTNFKTADGSNIVADKPMCIEDIRPNVIYSDKEGYLYQMNDNNILEKFTEYSSSSRYYTKYENNGFKIMFDRETGFTISGSEDLGYTVTNKQGKDICSIYPGGRVEINLPYGTTKIDEIMTIEDLKSDMILKTGDSVEYYYEDGVLTKRVDYYLEGDVHSVTTYESDGSSKRQIIDGYLYYSDTNGLTYRIDTIEGEIILDRENLFLEPDGTYERYYSYWDDPERGTYTIDEDGNFVCTSTDGQIEVYDGITCEMIKCTDADGNAVEVNRKKGYMATTRNGRTTYSKINHIEYDEEAYDTILKTFNDVDSSIINSSFSAVESELNAFPDKSSYDINGINNNVDDHIKAILDLEKMTNYSLLAYQTCDEELKQGLETLIDSLFGDTEKTLGDSFKKAIQYTINEKDGILGYNSDTSFAKTSCIIDLLVEKPDLEFLEGEELQKFIKDLNIRPLDSLIITKENVDINSIDFPQYRVIDANEYDSEEFNVYVTEASKAMSNVDKGVLKYLKDSGSNIVYFSSYMVDNGCYDGSGNFTGPGSYAGYASPVTRSIVGVVCWDPEDMLHEMGHTFDHSIRYRQNGDYGSTTEQGYDYSYLPDGINTRELAHEEYGAYDSDYVYVHDYTNWNNYLPNEFFAESFRNYYTMDEEKRAKFAESIPKTFEFFDKMEMWVAKQNTDYKQA